MCTAVAFENCFGRNLDLEYTYGESVVITPADFKFNSREAKYSVIGIAHVKNGYPLFYDGANEHGLWMAGLNFKGNAAYTIKSSKKTNVPVYDFLPYILSGCKTVAEARRSLKEINLVDIPFCNDLKTAELHWIIADKTECITVETTVEGMKIIKNSIGVLTNNPTFDFHQKNLSGYLHLSNRNPKSTPFGIKAVSGGLGGIGLPGDLTSPSRFVRAAFTKTYAKKEFPLLQLFKILDSVAIVDGTVKTSSGFMRTQYCACFESDTLTYYYKTYYNSQVTAVKLTPVSTLTCRKISVVQSQQGD